MGVCKCRKRTNLFCFVHSKAVCENCVVEDHANCFVSSYIDWLTNSAFDAPLCHGCKRDLSAAHEHPLRLECLHLIHEECLSKSLSALPVSALPKEYCCPTCKHPVVPDKWPLTSGVGAKISLFLRKHPFGTKLLPAPEAAVNGSGGSQPSTPLRAAMMGAGVAGGPVSPDVLIAKTPKARSRKPNEGGDVRVTVDDGAEDDEDKYANKDRRVLSPLRLFLLVLLVLLLLGLYLVFLRSPGLPNAAAPPPAPAESAKDDD